MGNQTVNGTPLTSIAWREKILWKSLGPINCLVTHILQMIFLFVQQKKETHTGFEELEGEKIMIV